jgi:hypothetical protein
MLPCGRQNDREADQEAEERFRAHPPGRPGRVGILNPGFRYAPPGAILASSLPGGVNRIGFAAAAPMVVRL